MAIQKINLGTAPTGAGGDTQRSANTKINQNFSNPDHAASKTVGTNRGQLPAVGANFLKVIMDSEHISPTSRNINNINESGRLYILISNSSEHEGALAGDSMYYDTYKYNETISVQWAYGYRQSGKVWLRSKGGGANNGEYSEWGYIYTSANTKLDTNGAVAPSSPTIDLYSDHIEPNADGERMGAEFVKNGVGDYTIKNTTGLREEGWFIKIPNDINGNPKIAVTVDTDDNGSLNIKTYKRVFSMETFAFGPDLDSPLDIPDGRWIDLRFNDLPQEEVIDDGSTV